MNKKYIVKTTAGNTILSEEDLIGSDVNGALFAKKVSDINIGEKVYFEKEYIEKTLKDIEEDLRKSPRYNAAEKSLYLNGKPALSHYLKNSPKLVGLTEDEMASKIYELIKDKVKTKQTVKNWISGKTLMPKDKETLILLADIAPDLSVYKNIFLTKDETKKEIINGEEIEDRYGTDRYALYDIYTNIRRGVMRYLSPAKGKGNGGEKKTSENHKHVSLGHEINIVVEKYFSEIDEKTISAQVTGIEELKINEMPKMPTERHEKLSRGVVTIKKDKLQQFLEENKINKVSLIDLVNDANSLVYALATYVKQKTKEKLNTVLSESEATSSVYMNFDEYSTDTQLSEMFEFPIVYSIATQSENILDAMEMTAKYESLAKKYVKLKNNLNEEEHNVIEKLMNAVILHYKSLPLTYIEFQKNLTKTSKLNIESLAGKIVSKREFDKLEEKSDRLEKILDRNYDFKRVSNQKVFKEIVAKRGCGISLTKEDGITALKKYGMDELISKIFQ